MVITGRRAKLANSNTVNVHGQYHSLGKVQHKKILSGAGYDENLTHMKIFLPQINRSL